MKKKILYIAALATFSIGCFFAGKNTVQTQMKPNTTENSIETIETMEKAFSHITSWETDENILYIYTNDGNYYSLEK